jgi:hypothetical protein
MPGAVVNNRLEAYTRGTDLRPGLEARVHDALWLLARQRQLGEFDGLDAGTPVSAALVVRSVPLASWQPAGGEAAAYAGRAPLEMLVESDGQPLPWRDQVAAGLRLARDLRRAGLDPAALIKAYPLQIPVANGVTPGEVAATSAVMAGRVLDPAAVAGAYAKSADTVVTTAGGEAARPVLAAWRTWWQSRTPAKAGAWQQAELSYALSASTNDASLPTYHADRFEGGSLDWHVFDIAPGTAATSGSPPPAPTRAVPVPVGFHGAPVRRYWQLDDARTDLGAIETYPTELAKLLLAEFTACFSGDWFRLPARVPYGSAARVEALVSTDTFGVSTLVPSAASGTGPWRMYEHTAIDGAADGSWLLVPPVLAGSMDSDPVEEVAFARDPAADLAWGIELVVMNAVGRPIRRSDDLAAQGRVPPPDQREGLPDAWVWRLATTVPENWIPLLPTRGRGPTDDYLLVQGSMLRYQRMANGEVTAVPIAPAGALLPGVRTLVEQEIPREGLTYRRIRRLSRRPDGGRAQWWSRTVSVGHGEASSGLAYDGLHATSDDPAALGQ